MGRILVFFLLLPLVVYLDVVKISGPVFSVLMVLMLPLFLICVWMRRGTKRAFSSRTFLLIVAFLVVCPVLTLFFANLNEQRIAEQVTQVAAHLAQYKSKKGQYPNTLTEVDGLEAQYSLMSDRSLKIGGRVVTYLHTQHPTATPTAQGESAKLSYWSFGAYQRQFFDVGSGGFDAPLID